MQEKNQNQTRDYAVLILISVLLGYITPKETTRKIDKLRTQMRKAINHVAETKPEQYLSSAQLADKVWEDSKKELGEGSKSYAVYVDVMCVTLYALLDGSPVLEKKRQWFSERTFDEAMNSLEAASGERTVGDEESYELRDMFARILGFPTSKPGLAAIKAKLAGGGANG